MGERQYEAFISYSRSDERWGAWLHRALETYRLPRQLAAEADRIRPVFRDLEELGASANLSESIRAALQQSRSLVVICSPAAAASRWVEEEVRTYIDRFGRNRVFCLLVEGAPNGPDASECLPAPLRGADEPLGADVRPGGDGKRLALLKLVSGITGIELARLRDRDAERRNRRVLQVAAGSFAGMVAMLSLAITAYLAETEARRQTAVAEQALAFSLDFFDAANPTVARRSDVTAREMLDQGVRRIAELDGQPEMQARMLSAVADIYFDLGEFEESLRTAERALELNTRLHGKTDERTIRDRMLLGRVLAELAQFERAEPHLRAGVRDATEYLGPTHAQTFAARQNLAVWYLDTGEIGKAVDALEAIFNEKTLVLGPDDPSTLGSATTLVVAHQRSGNSEAAARLAQSSLVRAREVLSPTDPMVLGLINNLAGSRMTLGEFEAAKTLYREHLDLTIEIFGDDSLAAARSRSNLGSIFTNLGEYEQGGELQQRAIEQQTALLGERHPITLRSRSNYANTLVEQGRYGEALATAEAVEALQREVLGAAHWDTLFTRVIRGYALVESSHDGAEAYLDALRPVVVDTLGSGHHLVAAIDQFREALEQ